MFRTAKKKAFTLLELIVVIVILGILAAIAVPTFQAVIQKSSDEATLVSLRAMAREAQALEAFDQNGWNDSDVQTAAADTSAAAPGVYAASLKATRDAGRDPAKGEVTYVIDGAGLALSKLSDSGRVCVVGANYSRVEKGSCGPSKATVDKSTLGVRLTDPGAAVFPSGTETTNGGGTTSPTVTAPDAPTGVAASPGSESATLSWTAPVFDGGAPITSYRVVATPSSGTPITKDTGSSATSYAFSGLTAGVSYTFTVAATNSAGTGAASAASTSVTPVAATYSLMSWGANGFSQLGNGGTANALLPTNASRVSASAEIVGGERHSCAVQNGRVYCWGSGGLLGNGSTSASADPVEVSGLTGVTSVAAGRLHTCAVAGDKTVKCWGANAEGQLGDGTTSVRYSPVTVSNITGAVQVTGGYSHTCALLESGSVRCWGFNNNYQTGDTSTTASRLTPVAVSGISTAAAVAAGGEHTCAVLSDGTARCWGYNAVGQLGNGGTAASGTPTTVSGLNSIRTLSLGRNHSCAVLANENVKCWGGNTSGELGIGTSGAGTDKKTPTDVPGLAGVKTLGAGLHHTCVSLSDQTVKCWGANASGQLGDGTTANRNSPTVVPNLTGVSKIRTGRADTTFALKS